MEKISVSRIIKAIIFILVFVLLATGLSFTVFSKQNPSLNPKAFGNSLAYTKEADQTIQVVVLGNSNAYSGFVPNVLWEEHGNTSVVVAGPKKKPAEALTTFVDVLKYQSPKVLLIETDMLYGTKVHNNIGVNQMTKDQIGIFRKVEVVKNLLRGEAFDTVMENFFSIFLLHSSWKNDEDDKEKKSKANTHGYWYSDKHEDVIEHDDRKETNLVDEVDPSNVYYLENLLSICEEENIIPILFTTPSYTTWNYQRHNSLKAIAEELGVDFYDCNLLYDELNFDKKNSFRDSGHLNYTGAKTLTDYFGKVINEKCKLEDLRSDENYKSWTENAEQFKKDMKLK